MVKFKYIWVISAFLAPLIATKSNAQVFIDLVGIMREAHCRDNYEELKNEPVCQEFYRGWNPTQRKRPNANIPSSSVPPQTPSTPSSSDNLYKQGNRLFEQGNYQGALVAFNRMIAINPQNAEAYASRSSVRYVLRDYRKALEDADRAISLNPSLASAYVVRGYVHHVLRNYQGELADANLVIRLDRSSPLGYMNRSTARYALGNYQGALADASQAIRLDPKLPEAYLIRSIARLALGDKQKALKDVNQAVRLGQAGIANNRLAGVYSVRSIIQYELGNVDQAMNDSRTAIALDRQSVGSMLILAVALHTRGDRQESLRLAAEAIQMDNNRSSLQYLKERGWGNRLLADTKTFFQSPPMQVLLTTLR
ncbi:hypothetical protein CEN50_00830 [Fischerella thermalis CCMEE 5268]|uniref:Uncharacterized protein n=1 Tax=Fischerella thermalis CCMEE 5268 TaxID=2019662 RepID=A0A2N6KM92_9CYAN|nr:tetratricopeptide repeat protein [Fischerella thermalis]PMB01035.1 hypothetical protein CEN50_00830 [Fischerella thermalis CCMEE 5268]